MLESSVQRQEIAEWFKVVMARTGMSARQWATKAKTAPSNITRLVADPLNTANPKPETILKLALAVPEDAKIEAPPAVRALCTLAGAPLPPSEHTFDLPLSPVEIIGHVQAGEWREVVDFEQEDRRLEYLPIPPEYRRHRIFGTVTRGTSMNRVFPEGTVLMCIPVGDYPHGIGHEDYVLVQRRNATGLVEVTVKQLMIDDNDRPWLWPRSDDPRWQAPIEIPLNHDAHPDAEEPEICIKAVVVRAFTDTAPKKRERRLLHARIYRKTD